MDQSFPLTVILIMVIGGLVEALIDAILEGEKFDDL